MSGSPSVSVVIPTYNRSKQLERTLAGLARQSFPTDEFEVVVVDDGSSDETHEYLRSSRLPLKVVAASQPNSGPATARNLGVSLAKGSLIVFVDDDIVPAPTLIAEHVRAHADLGDDVVAIGPMLSPDDFTLAPWVEWEQLMLYKQYEPMGAGEWAPTARQFYTGNASIRREHVLAVGGFDPTFRRAEDIELAFRLADHGMRFVFVPEAIGYHYADRSFESWIAIAETYGRTNVVLARDHGRTWILDVVGEEFGERHWLVRGMLHLCLPRPVLARIAVRSLVATATASRKLHVDAASRYALSGIYQLAHYSGVSDELGGSDHFFDIARRNSARRQRRSRARSVRMSR